MYLPMTLYINQTRKTNINLAIDVNFLSSPTILRQVINIFKEHLITKVSNLYIRSQTVIIFWKEKHT